MRDFIKYNLKKFKIDVFLSENKFDIQYITGIDSVEGSLIFLFKDKTVILTNKIYLDYLKVKLKNIVVDEISPSKIKEYLKNFRYGVDPYNFSYISTRKLTEINKNIKFISEFLSKIRAIKTKEEISKIKTSVKIAKRILSKLKKLRFENLTEKDLSLFLKKETLNLNLEESFPNIVATDKNSSYPHHKPGNKKIKNFFLVDFGIKKNAYCSDLTRFFIIDKMKFKPLLEKALKDVSFAKKMAEELIKPGERISKIVKKVEDFLKKRGWEKNIYHTLGHGIGIEVHEYPSLSNRNKNYFEENMVFTIEPGLYINGIGGIRIEDVYLLTKKGAIKL